MTQAEQKYVDSRKAYLQAMADLEIQESSDRMLAKAWDARRLEAEQLRAHIEVYAERLSAAGLSTDLPTITKKE